MARNLYVWLDNKIINSQDANIHILTHSLQYGSGIFEGIRAYDTVHGSAIFRLREHIKRFLRSAKIYGMEMRYTQSTLEGAVVSVVKKNALSDSYIRPFAFYNDQSIPPGTLGKKVSVAIANIPFGRLFDTSKGIKCVVSSWNRISSNTLPPQAKASGNYLNSILASNLAKKSGADEAILTSQNGYVAEGAGENIFLVEDNVLVTPSKSADILLGVTRDSIIKVAESMGIEVQERQVHREELYTCDEAFFTGTAAEVTPITSVDFRKVGAGKPGPVTSMLSSKYADVVHGESKEFADWLTFVG